MRADGSEFPIEVAVSVATAPEGDIYVGHLRDITARRQAESQHAELEGQLRQAQKMEAIGQLTGGIAHDFNNLLHVVNMNLELISMYAREEKVKPVVDRAKSAARRGAKLTGQLLSFARSQSLLPKLTHVNDLLLGMKDLLEMYVSTGYISEETRAIIQRMSKLMESEPTRPPTMRAVSTGPSSRTSESDTTRPMNCLPPNASSEYADCSASTMPVKSAVIPVIESDFTPSSSIWWRTSEE